MLTGHISKLKTIDFFKPTVLHFEQNLFKQRILKGSFLTTYNNRTINKLNMLCDTNIFYLDSFSQIFENVQIHN